jgi:hypothetical protein
MPELGRREELIWTGVFRSCFMLRILEQGKKPLTPEVEKLQDPEG